MGNPCSLPRAATSAALCSCDNAVPLLLSSHRYCPTLRLSAAATGLCQSVQHAPADHCSSEDDKSNMSLCGVVVVDEHEEEAMLISERGSWESSNVTQAKLEWLMRTRRRLISASLATNVSRTPRRVTTLSS